MSNRIRKYRKDARMTQAEAAQRAGMSQPNFQRIETSQSTPTAEQEVLIAAALGRDVGEVFPGGSHVELARSLNERLARPRFESDGRWDFLLSVGKYREMVSNIDAGARAEIAMRLESKDRQGFVVFDTDTRRVAFSLPALKYCKFTPREKAEDRGKGRAPQLAPDPILRCVHVGEDFATPYEIPTHRDAASGHDVALFFEELADDRLPRASFTADEHGNENVVTLAKDSLAYVEAPLDAFVTHSRVKSDN